MDNLRIVIGPYSFLARLERQAAPKTCAAFARLLPFANRVIHARWSGEAVWVPLGNFDVGVGFENHTSHPAPGQILLYPGGLSETEILLAYGSVCFSSRVGQLAGNHFLTITDGAEHLKELGRLVLWDGAQDIRFEAAPARDVSGERGNRTPTEADRPRSRRVRRRPIS